MRNHRPPNIAIDGPAGSGKTTVARLLARRRGLVYLDTGAMYRALTWKALQEGILPGDEEALGRLARRLHLRIVPDADHPLGFRLEVDGQDITPVLHSPEVDARVAEVARHPRVREEMVRRQQQLARGGGVVMVGRDIGTVVLPGAALKVYLTAALEERARRRCRDLRRAGKDTRLEVVQRDLERRDRTDRTRRHSPLVRAPDARELDTTAMDPEEVVDRIEAMLEEVS